MPESPAPPPRARRYVVLYRALGFTIEVDERGLVSRAPRADSRLLGLPLEGLRERLERGEGGAPGGVTITPLPDRFDWSRWEGPGGQNPIGAVVGPARSLVAAYDRWARWEDDADPECREDEGFGGAVGEPVARVVAQTYLREMHEAVRAIRAALADLDRLAADRPERLVRWPPGVRRREARGHGGGDPTEDGGGAPPDADGRDR